MNKNYRVITINGIRGVITAIFIVCGLIAGFIISPGWVCMKLWNYVFDGSNSIAMMNLLQGIMLWAIIALSLYALNNKRSLIGFGAYPALTPEQIRNIMEKARQSESKIIKDLENMNLKDELNQNPIINEQNQETSCSAEEIEEVRK